MFLGHGRRRWVDRRRGRSHSSRRRRRGWHKRVLLRAVWRRHRWCSRPSRRGGSGHGLIPALRGTQRGRRRRRRLRCAGGVGTVGDLEDAGGSGLEGAVGGKKHIAVVSGQALLLAPRGNGRQWSRQALGLLLALRLGRQGQRRAERKIYPRVEYDAPHKCRGGGGAQALQSAATVGPNGGDRCPGVDLLRARRARLARRRVGS